MPTAAKLIAGLGLGLTAAIAAFVFVLQQPEYHLGRNFVAGNMCIGFFVGWFTLGQNPGRGNFSAMFYGVRSLVLLLLASGIVLSAIFIFGNLANSNFREPMDLPLLWIKTSFNYVVLALSRNVAVALIIGGLLSGIATFQASLRWR